MVEDRFVPPIDLSQGRPVAEKVSPCLPVYDITWLSSYYRSTGVELEHVGQASPLHRGAAE
jgi:hypothetical protein